MPNWFLERSRVLSCLQVHFSGGGSVTSWFPCNFRNVRAWDRQREREAKMP